MAPAIFVNDLCEPENVFAGWWDMMHAVSSQDALMTHVIDHVKCTEPPWSNMQTISIMDEITDMFKDP